MLFVCNNCYEKIVERKAPDSIEINTCELCGEMEVGYTYTCESFCRWLKLDYGNSLTE